MYAWICQIKFKFPWKSDRFYAIMKKYIVAVGVLYEICFFYVGLLINLFETQALQRLAQERGHEIVENGADAVIVNTCTVWPRYRTTKISVLFINMRKENPHAVIAACGCFAQIDPERIRKTEEVDIICGARPNRGDRPV